MSTTQGRTFAYCRVSTVEQTTENQVIEITKRGYTVEPHRVVTETISGSTQASTRPEFKKLLERMESGDTLVVLKLDRLGRDNIDVQTTITNLTERGIKVVSLDLPVSDLTSPEGKLMLQLMGAFAEFERNRIRERTQEGLQRAKAEGKALGRPVAIDTTEAVQRAKGEGLSQSKVSDKLGISLATVKRHWNK
ncbi:recombinase family protein [Aeromonas veronii]|uniref:Resolvase n=3 Tax=Aeromonas veronii TaxID=654 RepID=A0ABY3MFL4_AERVE|nr:recombinase family protein [Aeromonas veronii]RDU77894.1 resolvase [Aeromonas veronii]RDU77931.1 resolvase [Aeromonas veronii]TEY43601.1 resolvase [Aeromonas veronii]TEY70417.1 resolvase [Aeromonas veronii]TYD39835.1 resolvase [Aeromonas veronii]